MIRELVPLAVLTTLLQSGAATGFGQSLDEATRLRVDAAVKRCLLADSTPSASVAIVIGDRVAYATAAGKAVLAPAKPASTLTRYQLASLSKTYTAQALLLLVAEGKLSLDDPVSRWFPELPEAANVRVRQLLSHTSGYPDHYPQSYPAGPRGAASTPDAIIAEWGRHPLLFAPGSQFRYSNLEYEMVGRIVEKISGEPLFAFMQRRIFRPAGMVSVLDLDAIPPGSLRLATGYSRYALAPLQPAPDEGPGWSFGAGQVVTTAEDVARWDVAFLQHRVLPEREAAEQTTPARLNDGGSTASALGLFVSTEDGVRRYYHSGESLGFESVNFIYPDAHMAIVVLTNTNATSTALRLAEELGYILLPPTANDLFARMVFRSLQKGRVDPAMLSEDLHAALNIAALKAFQTSLGPLGAVQSFAFAQSRTTDGLESRDYDLSVGGHALRLHLLLLADGKLEDVVVSDPARP